MKTFQDAKVGDRFDRHHGSGYFMTMEVVEIGDNLLTCAAVEKDRSTGKEIGLFKGGWTFDRKTGVEVDHDLKWGPEYGASGTYLKHGEQP